MNKKQPLNIPAIKSRIGKCHNEFIASVGKIPEKISADHQLILKRTKTRINAILKCFIEENIISDVIRNDDYIVDGDRSWGRFIAVKNGYEKYVDIFTDGRNIIMKSPIPYFLGFDIDSVTIRDIDFDNYEWGDFADQLLSFIHKVIYERVMSYQTKLFNG